MPTVDIHIVTFNNALTIADTLVSAFSQLNIKGFIRVIDNASIDQTRQIVTQFSAQLIKNKQNYGYAFAHNQALRLSDSDYICTLNPDVHLEPDFLQNIVEVLETNANLGSAMGCLYRVDKLDEQPTIIDSTGLKMSRSRRQILRFEGRAITDYEGNSEPIWGPDGAAAVYRRTMLDDIRINDEVFDNDFFMHKEDVDVCWRSQLYGWQSIYVPQSKGKHIRNFRPGRRAHVTNDLKCLSVRNRYLLMLKNERCIYFWRDIPFILTYDLGILIYLFMKERSSLKAYISALRLTRKMLAKRRQIQYRARQEKIDIQKWFY